ncbi:hypothetical protein BBBOND_0307350 [Babesia bigemina]|uniref:6-Cys domain-containing protein n=1 Tax=Babesia bigemina TaxID=5866 RepID=A0A061D840_BABBI|nr:hypothetical protein BBBOND_0307350 [Babesia bigemina]CDR96831.1 hypothetical protein BBBOND_0307350 [Babesia bigemina]|eukprot:XP_012769017.1 hypothetical protein BBBOND_0307350 [Babesia bigemina]
MRTLLVLGALLAHSIGCVIAFRCDFVKQDDLLTRNALAMCKMDVDDDSSLALLCPRRVNETEYVIHPQRTSDERANINTFVNRNGKFRSVPLSEVVRNEWSHKLAELESNMEQTTLKLTLPAQAVFAITERRLMFICGPKDLVLSEALQRHLYRLKDFDRMQALPWNSASLLVQEIAKIGKGLGVFFLYRGHIHLPLQGCGTRPSPLFSLDSEVTVDPITGVRSCVVDPMSQSPIGFVCEGRLEPADCMRSLIDHEGEVVAAPEPHSHLDFNNNKPWVVAKYFNGLALPPIDGQCRCVDSETGEVKARIEIRSKSEYVCDIADVVNRNRFGPMHGNWCSVVLHPGSTLTIRFPGGDVDSESGDDDFDEDVSTPPFSQLPPTYEHKNGFWPKDLTMLRQLSTPYGINVYDEIAYHKAVVGDALELDVSQMSRGEIKLKYNVGKPFALKGGLNSFFYHWTSISRNENVFERIRAIGNISFAFTHPYKMIGCDSGAERVFDSKRNVRYCLTKSMGNGIGDIHVCWLYIRIDDSHAGIRCAPDEELLPNNCEFSGYDLYSNTIMPFNRSVRSRVSHNIPGFQVFDFDPNDRSALSYACSCVDKLGYEKSRLILEYNLQDRYTYTLRREDASIPLLPTLILPWDEFRLAGEWSTSPISMTLNYKPERSIKLEVGTTLFLSCKLDEGLCDDEDNCKVRPAWLPTLPAFKYYAVKQTPGGPKLVVTRYKDVIAGTEGGFEVLPTVSKPTYYNLRITSNRGAIIISKDPVLKHQVPMTFICGKQLDRSDFGLLDTGIYSPSIPQSTATSQRYTWHAIEVNVETTDPYMQGCGVTYESDELFKPETPKRYDAHGKSNFGCKIDIHAAKEAAFYCPAPYVLDPPDCFNQVLVEGEVKNLSDISKTLLASRSSHFVTLHSFSALMETGETLCHTPLLECRCVTVKGVVLSTIQIENY